MDFFKDGTSGEWQDSIAAEFFEEGDMANYLAYSDIFGNVCRAIGDLNQSRLEEVKAMINMVYLNEICVCDELRPLPWLLDLIDDVVTKDEADLTGITKADPGVVTSAAHGFADGDIVQYGTVTGMTELSKRHAVVTNKAADTYELYDLAGDKINTSSYGAVGTAGTAYHRGVTLSKNYRRIFAFNFRNYSIPMEPIGIEELEKNTGWYDTDTSSKPSRYLHKEYASTAGTETQRLLWFTLPDDNYYARIWGEKIPVRLSSDTDVPILPARFHDTIVSGSIARMVQYGEVQIENAVIWPGLYKMHINAIRDESRDWWRKNNPDQRSGLYLL